jgi:tellurite resistance protein TerC
MGPVAPTALQQAKRLIKIVFALTLLVAGVAMLVLPGPGILAITFALAILSGEFVWARRLLAKIKASANKARDAVSQRRSHQDSHTP